MRSLLERRGLHIRIVRVTRDLPFRAREKEREKERGIRAVHHTSRRQIVERTNERAIVGP